MDRKHSEKRYFAAINSSVGFVSYFDEIFSPLSRLYIIKGGSGTGKSHLIRQFATEAEERGHEVEYYYCSSDPSSLDGAVVPDLSLGILDGTSPHLRDPRYPGIVDEIINVGDFWNTEKLSLYSEKIKKLTDKKSILFDLAYSSLRGAEIMEKARRRLLAPSVLQKKMRAAAERIMSGVKNGGGYSLYHRVAEAVTMSGRAYFPTLEENRRVYRFKDKYCISDLFLEEIRAISEKKELPVIISPDLLNPARIRTISLPTVGITLTSLDGFSEGEKILNTERFIDGEKLKEVRGKLRLTAHARDSFIKEAEDIFSEISDVHFEIEKYYISAMDFEKKDRYTKKLLSRIFK